LPRHQPVITAEGIPVALKSTVFKANLNVADLDRQHYADYALTVARHPSETDERMMLRLLAFALNASDVLSFGKGISTSDEPDLWRRSLAGELEQWIDLGTPEPDRLRKACAQARQVVLYAYGRRAVPIWWARHGQALARFDKLSVFEIPGACCEQLAGMAAATMTLQCTIEGGEAWFSSADQHVQVAPVQLKG
jgi:uncharacterized protein YaeQ